MAQPDDFERAANLPASTDPRQNLIRALTPITRRHMPWPFSDVTRDSLEAREIAEAFAGEAADQLLTAFDKWQTELQQETQQPAYESGRDPGDESDARAPIPFRDRKGQVMCTTNGQPVDQVRAEQTNLTGQHAGYIVLCEEERKKGFVRPYRDSYTHVGRSICGNPVDQATQLGGARWICDDSHGHVGECGTVTRKVSQPEHAEIWQSHRLPGCGTVTKMAKSISDTYARDPKFYGATFCCGCNRHLPVAEFVWTADGQEVGS